MRILVVGSLDTQVTKAITIASSRGATVSHVTTTNAALEFLRSGSGSELLMVDVRQDIKSLVTSLNSERITITVVAYGIDNDSKAAVASIKNGAKEYIPFPPDEKLIAAVLEAISAENSDMIAESDSMKRAVQLCNQVAPSEANIMISGESGTGKEVLAKYIHKKSKRSAKPMVCVNCAAIPDNLLESELFGHEKGAFTGAVARRIGKFEEANCSTLLLDEISEMDIRLQAKLLRAIQEREIDRVGGSKPVKINIRIIATSNRNLLDEVKSGNFREDLYFRLNVINICPPPLRERKQDIPKFADYFLNKYSQENALPLKKLSDAAQSTIMNYDWPGNVREIENTMHRAVLISLDSEIKTQDLLLNIPQNVEKDQSNNTSNMVGKTIGAVEKDLIINTLDHCLGNRTQAANILGISIRTLRNKLNEYNKQEEVA